jgi:predicted DsbA family dithiol-disulfide isomerase
MVDSLFDDRARVDDPHLWKRAEAFGLDLERFEADRRCDEIAERVRRDFESGIRAGVTATPTLFSGQEPVRLEQLESSAAEPSVESPLTENESS